MLTLRGGWRMKGGWSRGVNGGVQFEHMGKRSECENVEED